MLGAAPMGIAQHNFDVDNAAAANIVEGGGINGGRGMNLAVGIKSTRVAVVSAIKP